MQGFLDAAPLVQFAPAEGEDARCSHIEAVLKRFGYRRLGRAHKERVLPHPTALRHPGERLLRRAAQPYLNAA